MFNNAYYCHCAVTIAVDSGSQVICGSCGRFLGYLQSWWSPSLHVVAIDPLVPSTTNNLLAEQFSVLYTWALGFQFFEAEGIYSKAVQHMTCMFRSGHILYYWIWLMGHGSTEAKYCFCTLVDGLVRYLAFAVTKTLVINLVWRFEIHRSSNITVSVFAV